MKWLGIAALTAAGIMLAACATPIFDKPGATQQDFNVDSYAGERDARQTNFMGPIDRQRFFNRCMVSKGWVERS